MFNQPLLDYYRCPGSLAEFDLLGELSRDAGFFLLGQTTCYGQSCLTTRAGAVSGMLGDVSQCLRTDGEVLALAFNPQQVIDNLRLERYVAAAPTSAAQRILKDAARAAYYRIRPFLTVPVRKHLQRCHLAGWQNIVFPSWPVDFTVETLLEKLLLESMRARRLDAVPFIWFWPEGHSSCALMTHDVETATGRDFCRTLMDWDEAAGILSSFQIVPEGRYDVAGSLLHEIRERGFEVNIHDLNHDGLLFRERREFEARAKRINRYRREYGAEGFRSGALYRNLEWYEALEFSYDMSVPNVAHLDPQRGGCCSVMPFFVGDMLELPVTATQDYTLFNLLGNYSLDLWKQQIELIIARHGLVSFIVHPDYLLENQAKHAYLALLTYLTEIKHSRGCWLALPADVNRWWRARRQMSLTQTATGWKVEGRDCERARVAWAHIKQGRLVYEFGERPVEGSTPLVCETVAT